MNKKTIKKVLRKKFGAWLATLPEDLQKMVKDKAMITGGAIANMLLGEPARDFDVYFKDKGTVKAVAEYYVSKFKDTHPNYSDVEIWDSADFDEDDGSRIKIIVPSSGIAADDPDKITDDTADVTDQGVGSDHDEGEEKKEQYRPIFLSPNAITLSQKIQITVRFYGQIEEIHANYDFVHCTTSWDSETDEVTLPADALESLLSKHLRYMGSKYPICSIIRTRKFLKRGWHINAGQYLKMCFQVGELDLQNIEVLKDQLVGVDSAYFYMMIEALARKREEDPEFTFEDGYIATIIDKIF